MTFKIVYVCGACEKEARVNNRPITEILIDVKSISEKGKLCKDHGRVYKKILISIENDETKAYSIESFDGIQQEVIMAIIDKINWLNKQVKDIVGQHSTLSPKSKSKSKGTTK